MINAYKRFWRNYINFSGTTNRPDYWLAWLMNVIIYLIAAVVLVIDIVIMHANSSYVTLEDGFDSSLSESNFLLLVLHGVVLLYSLAIIIPSLSIMVRRLRDAGFHWGFMFLNLIPWGGYAILIILLCLPANSGSNYTFGEHYQVKPDEIEKWHQLKEQNVITQEEYDAKKKELL